MSFPKRLPRAGWRPPLKLCKRDGVFAGQFRLSIRNKQKHGLRFIPEPLCLLMKNFSRAIHDSELILARRDSTKLKVTIGRRMDSLVGGFFAPGKLDVQALLNPDRRSCDLPPNLAALRSALRRLRG